MMMYKNLPAVTNHMSLKVRKKVKLQKEMPLSVAICTPLMARVNQRVPQAGEMMLVDSSSSMDIYTTIFPHSSYQLATAVVVYLYFFQ